MKSYLFPAWAFTDETYFLACVLHDIGSTDENLKATKLSFEFYGGLLALDVLQRAPASAPETAAPKDQAESVAEAIIRHQDLCENGKITAVGQLLQLATIFGMLNLPL
jgi:cyanamide hydratase